MDSVCVSSACLTSADHNESKAKGQPKCTKHKSLEPWVSCISAWEAPSDRICQGPCSMTCQAQDHTSTSSPGLGCSCAVHCSAEHSALRASEAQVDACNHAEPQGLPPWHPSLSDVSVSSRSS